MHKRNEIINLTAIFQALPAAYLLLDVNLSIIAATDSYYELTFSKPDDLIGRLLSDVFPENSWTVKAKGAQRHKKSFERVLRDGHRNSIPVQRYDIRLPPNSGGKFVARWWRITNSPVFSASGELTHIIHAIEDVSTMIDVLEEAENAHKKISSRSPGS